MTFLATFNSNYISNINTVPVVDILLTIILSLAIGALIRWVYKKTFSGVMYSSTFATSLVSMTVITAVLILAVTSNVVLSLGMVGALSIVRFRAAIKDPIDIIFLFWSIASGIILAAGLMVLAIVSALVIAAILIVLLNNKVHSSPYMLVLHLADSDKEDSVASVIQENVNKSILKSKTFSQDTLEVNYEVHLKDNNSKFLQQLSKMDCVKNVALVSYNGEYMN